MKHDWRANPVDCPKCKQQGGFQGHMDEKPPHKIYKEKKGPRS